jgi:hypothetical protein
VSNGLVEHDDNTEDEAADVKATRESSKARARRVKAAWEVVIQTPEGRAVIWDMLAAMGMNETPLIRKADGSISIEDMLLKVGVSNHARKAYMEIANDYPAMMPLMVKENA